MKKDMLSTVLTGILAVSAIVSLICFFFSASKTREVRGLQPQVMAMNNNINLFNALFNETSEYAKRNPALDTALQSNPLWKNRNAAQAPAAKPAAK